ncbi:MAG: hypothetical protein M3321_08995 [Actinomycetota bacterium]|nr:hypothetical protein [Actinomycetota bacterium]
MATAEAWGPVRRGFTVAFPEGESGRVEQIRVVGGSVELLVAAASGRLVAVESASVEAILPRRRRILVGSLPTTDGAAGVEAAGGIIRMPARHSSRIAGPPDAAA